MALHGVSAWLVATQSAHALTLDWVSVGDPGNACHAVWWGCVGTVAQVFEISRYETTNAQYAEFLNAVAKSDPHALYHASMGSDATNGGIARSGASGSFTYSVKLGFASKPVNYVSFWDALRFANWMHNGKPVGPQGPGTTEDGAYTLTPTTIASNTVARDADARVFLPNRDEWHKAAYYDGASSYFSFPTASSSIPDCTDPTPVPNAANCARPFQGVTNVGAYTGSASPSGTFDQGGNVREWIDDVDGADRSRLGGSFDWDVYDLVAGGGAGGPPTGEFQDVGFRVARLAPTVPALGLAARGALFALLLATGAAARRRPQSRAPSGARP